MACTMNSPTVALSIASGVLRADVIVDPAAGIPPNLIVANAAGVYVYGADGWLAVPATLAYSSASSPTYVATTSVDLTSFISPGMKLKLTQAATVRYFVVVAITAGNITLYGGDAQVLANSAITLPAFGLRADPVGFPDLPCSNLPTVAFDGMKVSLIVDASNGIEWEVKYKSAEPTYKWRFIGGPMLFAEVAADQAVASAGSYQALGTVGPSIVVPRAGDYNVSIGSGGYDGADSVPGIMSYDIGGTGAVDADGVYVPGFGGGGLAGIFASGSRPRVKTGLAASTTLTAKYKTSFGTGYHFFNRWMQISPVRIV